MSAAKKTPAIKQLTISPRPEESSNRILISRMSAIGDTILTLPVAGALRDAYPDAFLAWVVERKSAAMVRGHEFLDAVIELERGWFTSPKGIWDARQRLRALQVDTAIDCQGNTKSALACHLSGAKRRIGHRGYHGAELSQWLNNVLVKTTKPHLTDRSLGLLGPLAIKQSRIRWQLPVPAEARAWAKTWRRQNPQRLVILNPGASWDSKLWEMDRFGAVASYLETQYQAKSVVIWGNAKERALAEEVIEMSGGSATLAPDTDLLHLAALLGAADMMISADSGPMHMAVAMGTQTIGLHGSTRAIDSGPYGPPHRAVQRTFHDGTRRERRSAANTAMRAISVEDVQAEIDRIFSKRQANAA
ncbi:Lipopolysaccharide core heptosyltransferase RfaQ [Roseimaritima multifibrata]|uniref:Lipopolysaccharide core heptosyltransferase RfaQ n=1 Tax=Roseimaritima multifibrata TaxID=1930274 RepID=A0A517MEF3_9BACT|nr:glycosyltransferase family 9 protein [Roseimaritima multifibrata]QDS93157.1 Lipopolysaccharide core heptosyltransferase RfaQ [Roseimaritima multifibrata]